MIKRKSIFFGSIFVLTLMLLMPSIPAIQKKTIKDKAFSDFIEELNDFDLKGIEKLEWIKHPILYTFVKFIYLMNCMRSVRIVEFAKPPGIVVEYPLLYIYGFWVALRGAAWFGFWFFVSNKYDWNWDMLDF